MKRLINGINKEKFNDFLNSWFLPGNEANRKLEAAIWCLMCGPVHF